MKYLDQSEQNIVVPRPMRVECPVVFSSQVDVAGLGLMVLRKMSQRYLEMVQNLSGVKGV